MKLAHITDLHIRLHTPGLAPNSPARFHEAYGTFLQALEKIKNEGVDRIVLTGDIVDVPGCVLNPTDYYTDLSPLFLPAIGKDYQAVRDALEGTGIPYSIIPGNHDHYPSFLAVFPEPLEHIDQGGFRFVGYHDREWGGNVPHRYDRERKRMVAELSASGSPPQIHLQHFIPFPLIEGDYPFNYHDADNIAAHYAGSGKVVLSLSGHYHPGTGLVEKDGVIYATGKGFCEEPFPFRIYNIDENGVSMEEFQTLETPLYAGKPLAILDRDGVINTLATYRSGPEEMKLIPGAAESIRKLKEAGYVVVINTNQSCVGMGEVPQEVVDMNHDYLCHLLAEEAGTADAQPDIICYSVQAGSDAVSPEFAGSDTVKPATILVDQAVELHGLETAGAWMVGDRMSDMEFARRFGARPILVLTGDGQGTRDRSGFQALENVDICENLSAATSLILDTIQKPGL
ncbi:MAG: HAD-IIIA family hydrolase [Verrucomicrobiota bacterium]